MLLCTTARHVKFILFLHIVEFASTVTKYYMLNVLDIIPCHLLCNESTIIQTFKDLLHIMLLCLF
jgi:hypothetical protein